MNETNDNDLAEVVPQKDIKKIIIISAIALVVIIAAIVAGLYISQYTKAKNAYDDAVQMITKEQYCNSFEALTKIKTEGKIKKFRESAEEKISELYALSKDKYSSGADIYANDDAKYSKTKSYFIAYGTDFSFDSSNKTNAQKIITSIDEYNKANEDYEDLAKYKDYVEANEDLIKILASYIDDVNKVYNLANKAINKNSSSSLVQLRSIWYRKNSYLYGIVDDIETLKGKKASTTLFTTEECDSIREYIIRSLLPCEIIYNASLGKKYNEKQYQRVRDNWTIRDGMKEEVTGIVEQKTSFVKTFNSSLKLSENNLERCKKNLSDQFTNISSKQSSETNTNEI